MVNPLKAIYNRFISLPVQTAASATALVSAPITLGTQFVHQIGNSQRYNASQPENLPNQLQSTLWPHLKNCLDHDIPLISFHSPLGHKMCSHLAKPDRFARPDREPQKPSALQLFMQHGQAKTVDGKQYKVIQINNENGKLVTLTLKPVTMSVSIDDAVVPYIEAEVLVEIDGQPQKPLHILEMSPHYDGNALDQYNLTTCYEITKDFYQEKGFNKDNQSNFPALTGQFSSAMGIGRSASLVVMSQFDELLNTLDTSLTENEIQSKVEKWIESTRETTGNLQFIHSAKQLEEIVNACKKMYEQFQLKKIDDDSNQSFYSCKSSGSSSLLSDPFVSSSISDDRDKPVLPVVINLTNQLSNLTRNQLEAPFSQIQEENSSTTSQAASDPQFLSLLGKPLFQIPEEDSIARSSSSSVSSKSRDGSDDDDISRKSTTSSKSSDSSDSSDDDATSRKSTTSSKSSSDTRLSG